MNQQRLGAYVCSVLPDVFDLDWSEAEVGAHREVRNRSDENNRSCDVVEKTVTAVFAEGQSYEAESGN
jgi:hypothetical protein